MRELDAVGRIGQSVCDDLPTSNARLRTCELGARYAVGRIRTDNGFPRQLSRLVQYQVMRPRQYTKQLALCF